MSNLIINPIGGLANRMRAIASGIALANALNVPYKIIWYKNSELYAKFEDLFTPINEVSSHILYPTKFSYYTRYSAPRKKNLYITNFCFSQYGLVLHDGQKSFQEILTSNNPDTTILNMAKNTLKKGKDCYIQSGCQFFTFSQDLYKRIFRPSKQIELNANKIIHDLESGYIGVHIRRTDNKESIKNSTDDLFTKEIASILSNNPHKKIYLASDDITTKKQLQARFGNSIVIDNTPVARNTLEGMINAATEMYILSSADLILGSYFSSYSEAAAILGNAEYRVIKKK